MDPERRAALQAEARKTRVQWIEDARRISPDDAESEAREAIAGTCSDLARALPCALTLHDFLRVLGGDVVVERQHQHNQQRQQPDAEVLSDILLPFALSEDGADSAKGDGPLPTHRPNRSSYDTLLDKLKHRLASEVVNNLEQFVFRFIELSRQQPPLQPPPSPHDSSTPTVAAAALRPQQHVAKIHAFLQRTAKTMREHMLWRGESEPQWADTVESLERLVMYKLYDVTFRLAADDARDAATALRLQSLSFVGFEHLDMAPLVSGAGASHADLDWSAPRAHLLRLDGLRSPGDKLACVLACFDAVADVLRRALGADDEDGSSGSGGGGSGSGGGGGREPGADELLPALIYLVKSTNPPRLASNLEYLQTFAAPERLVAGRASYALTQLASALHFLENADAGALSMDPEEFERRLGESRRAAADDMKKHTEDAAAAARAAAGTANGEGGSAADGEGEGRGEEVDGAFAALSASQVSAMRRRERSAAAGDGSVNGDSRFAPLAAAAERRHGWGNGAGEKSAAGAAAAAAAASSAHALRAGLKYAGIRAEELRLGELPALVSEYQQLLHMCEGLLQQQSSADAPT